MSLGDAYASAIEFKDRIDDAETVDDGTYTQLLAAVSLGINHICQRQFNKATSATARTFRPTCGNVAYVDDFWTTSGLVIALDSDGDGVYERTLTASEYFLEPLNGIVNGVSGWPYYRICLTESVWFTRGYSRPSLQVTAQWGWAGVPEPVKQVCLDATTEALKIKEVSFVPTVRLADNPRFMAMLQPYMRYAIPVR